MNSNAVDSARLNRVEAKLDIVVSSLNVLLTRSAQEATRMSTLSDLVTKLEADDAALVASVQTLVTADQGLIAAVNNIPTIVANAVAAAQAAGADQATIDALTKLSSDLEGATSSAVTEAQAAQAAVAAQTSSAPAAPAASPSTSAPAADPSSGTAAAPTS